MPDKETVQLLHRAAGFFDLGNIQEIHHFPEGLANQNYELRTNSGSFVLKELLEHTYEETLLEIVYLQRVQAYHFPAPELLQSPEGDFMFLEGDLLLTAQQKVIGKRPLITEKVCGQVGDYMGRLHQIPFDGLPPKNHWMKEEYLPKLLEAIKERLYVYVKSSIETYERLKYFYSPRLPKTLIHGDVNGNNLIFKGEELQAILDWEEVGVGPAILDLGEAILDLCLIVGGVNKQHYRAFMEGYLSQRKLGALEMECLPLAVRYMGLTNSAWTILRYSGPTSESGVASVSDPDEAGDFYWRYKWDEFVLPKL